MSSLFDDLKEGLKRQLRMKAGMIQSVFAAYMGVSKKTMEVWKGGRMHPTDLACRLLHVLALGEDVEYIVAK